MYLNIFVNRVNIQLFHWRKNLIQSWLDLIDKIVNGPVNSGNHRSIDLIHKSHNALVPYPKMHHSEQKCTHLCSQWCIVGYGKGALRDLLDWSITCFSYRVECCYNMINPIQNTHNRYLTNITMLYLFSKVFLLTHCGLVTPYGDIDLGQHWPR